MKRGANGPPCQFTRLACHPPVPFWLVRINHFRTLSLTLPTSIHMCSPYQLSNAIPVCDYQKISCLTTSDSHKLCFTHCRDRSLFRSLDSPSGKGGSSLITTNKSCSYCVGTTRFGDFVSHGYSDIFGHNRHSTSRREPK